MIERMEKDGLITPPTIRQTPDRRPVRAVAEAKRRRRPCPHPQTKAALASRPFCIHGPDRDDRISWRSLCLGSFAAAASLAALSWRAHRKVCWRATFFSAAAAHSSLFALLAAVSMMGRRRAASAFAAGDRIARAALRSPQVVQFLSVISEFGRRLPLRAPSAHPHPRRRSYSHGSKRGSPWRRPRAANAHASERRPL